MRLHSRDPDFCVAAEGQPLSIRRHQAIVNVAAKIGDGFRLHALPAEGEAKYVGILADFVDAGCEIEAVSVGREMRAARPRSGCAREFRGFTALGIDPDESVRVRNLIGPL